MLARLHLRYMHIYWDALAQLTHNKEVKGHDKKRQHKCKDFGTMGGQCRAILELVLRWSYNTK
jgi:hypothetical protein